MKLFFSLSEKASLSACILCVAIIIISPEISWAQGQAPLFPVTPEIGQPATSSVLADFNGDGKLDVAFLPLLPGATGLSVTLDLAGSSPTTINTSVCSSTGTGPIAVGDVNNDKKPDVVMSCSGYIAVLLGKGDGTFQAPVYYANQGGGNLAAPALVDLNGDGYLDVAIFTAVANTSSLTVYLNGGSVAPGTYGAPKNYSLGSVSGAFYGPLSGDFNGDGKQDLLLLTGTNLIVLYGNGDGTLQAQQTQALPASSFSPSAAIGDFNHDGATDVAYNAAGECCTPGEQASIQILLGNSNGVFAKGSALPIAPENGLLASAQLTNDGNLDLVVTGGFTTVFRGDGKGGFTEGASYAASGMPLVGDLNGDGKLDLLLANGQTPTGAGFFFLDGNGDGTFEGVPTVPINTNGSVVYADLNGDGIADAVYQSSPLNNNLDSSIVSALGRGDGTFTTLNQSISLVGALNTSSALVIGDFNGDGKPDLAVAAGVDSCPAPSGNNGTISIFPGNGNGSFGSAISTAGLPSDLGPIAPVVGDFNGDGKLDLVVPYGTYSCLDESDTPPTGLIFLPGKGDGTFGTPADISAGVFGRNLFVGDLNKDGKLDLLWQGIDPASGNSQGSTIYLGNGDGTFKQQPLSGAASGKFLALTDLNGDGIPDLALLSGGLGNTVVIFAGNGDGTFQATPFYTVPLPQQTQVETLSAGDVNGDGHPDIVVMYSGLQAATGA